MSNRSLCRGKIYWKLTAECPDCGRTFTARNAKLYNKLLQLHVKKEHNQLNVAQLTPVIVSHNNTITEKMLCKINHPSHTDGEYKPLHYPKTKKSKIPQ